jgi:hypothetical protein
MLRLLLTVCATAMATSLAGRVCAQQGTPASDAPTLQDALRVEFDGDCLQREALMQDVLKWLKRNELPPGVQVEVTGQEQPMLGASFSIERDGSPVSIRRFQPFSGTCSDLRAALGAAMALAIESLPPRGAEPGAASSSTGSGADKPHGTRPKRSHEQDEARADEPGESQSFEPALWLGASGLGGLGVMNNAAFGLQMQLDLELLSRLNLRGGPVGMWAGSKPLAHGRFVSRVSAARLGACWGTSDSESSTWRLRGCVDMFAGAHWAQGKDFAANETTRSAWFVTTLGPRLEFRPSQNAALFLDAAAVGNWTPPEVTVRDPGNELLARERPGSVGALIGLGAAFRVF